MAPTPSGFLHLGNVLSFAVTAALAKQTAAKTLLRIDDLDQARANRQYVQDIFETIEFLKIPRDEGPENVQDFESNYSQLHRADQYNAALYQLRDEGFVFACTCSRQQINIGHPCTCQEKKIPLMADTVSWRLFTDEACKVNIKNIYGETQEANVPYGMKNFVVRKKDGFPSYQLTSVIDDLFFGVDLVIRGQDLWPSTVAQQILADKLGRRNIFGKAAFYHHPLIMETPGVKLSKSAGATSIKYLRENGKSAAGIFQLIASMANIGQPVNNWKELGEAFINQNL